MENLTTSAPVDIVGFNPQLFMFYVSQTLPFKIFYVMSTYGIPTISAVGLVGNTLAMMVVTRNLKISCYIYMAVLAVTDSVAQFANLSGWSVQIQEPFEYRTRSTVCRIVGYSLAASIMCSTYIIVAMTLERLVAVKWPLKALHWCTTKKAKINCFAIILGCCLFKLPYAWVSGALTNSNSCSAFRGEQTTLLVTYYRINTVVGNYIPFCSLLIMNCLIIHSIRSRRANLANIGKNEEITCNEATQRTEVLPDSNKEDADDDIEIQTTGSQMTTRKMGSGRPAKTAVRDANLITMLLLVSFSFLICSAPVYANYIVYMFVDRFASPYAYGMFLCQAQLSMLLLNIGLGNNFFLYCLSGTKFRMELKLVFRRLCRGK